MSKPFLTRLPDDVHEELRRRGYETKTSMNQLILLAVKEFLAGICKRKNN
jgi:hypothetical protein